MAIRAKTIQSNFTSGELDPLVAAREDLKYYYNGAAKMINVIPLPQGGFKRRPGMKHLWKLPEQLTRLTGMTITATNGGTTANANDDDTSTVLTSTTAIGTNDPYVLVHYDLGSAQTVRFADVVGIRQIGATDGLDEWYIQYSTDNTNWNTFDSALDTLSATAKVIRRSGGENGVSARYWRVVKIGGTDASTDTAELNEFSLWTESGSLSEIGFIEFEFSTTQTYLLVLTDRNITVVRNGAEVLNVRSPYTSAQIQTVNWTQSADTVIMVHEDVQPQTLIRNTASEGIWDIAGIAFVDIPQYDFVPVEDAATGTTLTPSAVEGSITLTTGGAYWSAASVGQIVTGNGGRARITAYTSTTVVKAQVLIPFWDTNAIASGSWTYHSGYEDAWSSSRGWPRSCCFFEGRLWIGGSKSRPTSVWGSVVDEFYDFNPGGGNDDEAIGVTLDTDQLNSINNIYPGRDLQVFTSGGEFYFPKTLGEPLTPSNAYAKRQTSRGSSEGLRVVEVDGGTMFVDAAGNSVREFLFSEVDQSYGSANLATLSSHLLTGPVDFRLRRAISTSDTDLLIVVNSDGTAAICATIRTQEVIAWAQVTTSGTILESAALRDNSTNPVYWGVERTANSETHRYLEMWDDAHFLDASVRKTSGLPSSTISALGHIEGESVRTYIDESAGDTKTVSSGSITVSQTANTSLEAGLWFQPKVKTMPWVAGMAEGTPSTRKKRIARTTINMYETQNLYVDGKLVRFRKLGDNLNTAAPKFTGIKHISLLGYTETAQRELTQESPGTMTIRSIAMEVSL